MATFVLCAAYVQQVDGESVKLWPGTLITDPSVIATLQLAGVPLGGDGDDPIMIRAAAEIASARALGADDRECSAIMMGALMSTGAAQTTRRKMN